MKKSETFHLSHWSESDENAIDCEIAGDCLKRANVVLYMWNFRQEHTATHKRTSAQPVIVTTMARINRLWSPKAYGLARQ